MSFFDQSQVISKRQQTSLIPRCGACGLLKVCDSPKMPVSGSGKKGILIFGEAPGADEDRQGKQFVGKAGQVLRKSLRKFDIDLDRDCWKTNSLICRPPHNRDPKPKELDYCRPNLLKAIQDLNPKVIIPLGKFAVKSIMTPLWKDNVGSMRRWAGWTIPCRTHNAWICPTFHPSYVARSEDDKNGPVVKLWFERHLEKAVQLNDRPWTEIPDESKQIKVITDPDKAAAILRKFIQEGGPVSFDYETNRLKPDASNAEIVCCSVCWRGKRTIAYPWVGEAIKATAELLQSDLPKVGANIKFEERWTRRILGIHVNNWVWDCVQAAHNLDNRPKITSVKFQAFIRLGLEPWDHHIHPFLSSTDKDGLNQIRKIDLRSLLVYCGIDSLVEYQIAVLQKKEAKNGT